MEQGIVLDWWTQLPLPMLGCEFHIFNWKTTRGRFELSRISTVLSLSQPTGLDMQVVGKCVNGHDSNNGIPID